MKKQQQKKQKRRRKICILEAQGKGLFLGVTHSIVQNQGDWWGEGDEMIYID